LKILVVEDEKKTADFLKRGLEEDECTVTVAHDGVEGLKQAQESDYSLAIVDLKLPKKDGLALIRELRESGSQLPVMILSGSSTTEDIISGLDAGADDYVTKPFTFAVLVARVKALLRRSSKTRGAEIAFADLRLDPVTHKVWRSDTEIVLSAKEYGLLEFLMRNPGKALSRKEIADSVWDYEFDNFSNIIDVYVNYLRKKVDQNYSNKLIHTVRKQGYALYDEQTSVK
jgi:two-component system, OmpR family, copper resistance phosphate regulon response regulator CusR